METWVIRLGWILLWSSVLVMWLAFLGVLK
jgi:hypothetical protein